MIDIRLLRKKITVIAKHLAFKKFTLDIAFFQNLELERQNIQSLSENLKSRKNKLSKDIGAKKSNNQSISAELHESIDINEQLSVLSRKLNIVEQQLYQFLLTIPNLTDDSVPIGKSNLDNKEILRWGDIPVFPFEIKDHVDLGNKLGLDLDVASKITGSRFSVMYGQLAYLHRALIQFMLDQHIKRTYKEVYVPYIVNSKSMQGAGQLPKFENALFKIQKKNNNDHLIGDQYEDFYLIPTAEVPITNLMRDTILSVEKLPLRFVAHTPCFRAEAGSYGKDTRGIIRQHQFEKIELVQFVQPENSMQALEEITEDAERILQLLELPYRKVLLCTADTGFSSSKTYDLEVWLPAQNTYREISSCSNTSDFQARRILARFKYNQKKSRLLHILNGSALAIGRTILAILENYQQADGSVKIPRVLQKYMNNLQILSPML